MPQLNLSTQNSDILQKLNIENWINELRLAINEYMRYYNHERK